MYNILYYTVYIIILYGTPSPTVYRKGFLSRYAQTRECTAMELGRWALRDTLLCEKRR